MLEFLKNISPAEMILILIVLLVLFGSKIISGAAKTGGQTVKELKNFKNEFIKATEPEDDEDKKTAKKS